MLNECDHLPKARFCLATPARPAKSGERYLPQLSAHTAHSSPYLCESASEPLDEMTWCTLSYILKGEKNVLDLNVALPQMHNTLTL